MNNPYKGLPDTSFWRRSVAGVERHEFDPVVAVKFQIKSFERVVTAGSCFAQHISRKLSSVGFNYFVTEAGDGLSDEERRTSNYGVFSARYGNIYTSRQLIQLLHECYDGRVVAENAWLREDGRWVDSLRPQIEPAGYESEQAVQRAREAHLRCVREAFEACDILVFTLGLTETWRSRADGTVFPVAPGVSGGSYDPERHEFVNLDVSEVVADMEQFLQRLKSINPRVKVVLTVSPVPLIATYESEHVLCATTYSKSVLRAAAGMLTRGRDWVDYYPSYEIITGNYSRSLYYEFDYRSINSLGVAHAMRCFERHYVEQGVSKRNVSRSSVVGVWQVNAGDDIVCDEEAIDKISI